jgi:hypothetical protein
MDVKCQIQRRGRKHSWLEENQAGACLHASTHKSWNEGKRESSIRTTPVIWGNGFSTQHAFWLLTLQTQVFGQVLDACETPLL